MNEVVQRIDAIGTDLAACDRRANEQRFLPEAQIKQLIDAGVFGVLQPKEFGGSEGSVREFLEAVLQVGHYSPSAGWISGVVGVHPWELALTDVRLQKEIWGENSDTLVASPYAPFGRARPVDGGVLFSGRWPYSTGTDHCQWVILGGMMTDEHGDLGAQPEICHFILPRADYTIIEDSWYVMGLQGSGSRDVEVKDAFIPDYRIVHPGGLNDGSTARSLGQENHTYWLPFGVVFSASIAAGTIGIAEGALLSFTDFMRDRVRIGGIRVAKDPYQLAALGEATADVAASRLALLNGIDWAYEILEKRDSLTMDERLVIRSNQVRASRRAVDAIDTLFAHSGASSLRLDNPLQGFWRDLHAAMNHVCNVAEPVYQAYGLNLFGEPVPPGVYV
jgi:3-hydroxy-9,10-secoandrosta-1,3,5(10)-triene-9,17-dione monooxygenase